MKNIFKNISKIKYILPLLVLVVCVAFAVNSFTIGSFSADSVIARELSHPLKLKILQQIQLPLALPVVML